jgi:hypothetical protein
VVFDAMHRDARGLAAALRFGVSLITVVPAGVVAPDIVGGGVFFAIQRFLFQPVAPDFPSLETPQGFYPNGARLQSTVHG